MPTRRQASRLAPGSIRGRRPGRVEHEYERRGALASFAAWDVHRAQVFGRCEQRTGIAPFGRLVSAGDGPGAVCQRAAGLLGRRQRQLARACHRSPSSIPRCTRPGSTQVELYFSVDQRKVLNPNDFASLAELGTKLLAFGDRYSAIAAPFEWRFTRSTCTVSSRS
ncbi:MAG: hypothetical protein ACYDCI_12210 [Candidatus Limnocylindrales bacterium]